MEGNSLGLDLTLLHVDLVPGQNDGDVFANANKITCLLLVRVTGSAVLKRERTVPVGDVLVGDARRDVEHDDTALSVDVVAIAETTKLLLTCGVPYVKLDLSKVLLLVSVPSW